MALKSWPVSLGEAGRDGLQIDSAPRAFGKHLGVDAEFAGILAPHDREQARLKHQHLVAFRQRVGKRCFPRAMTVGGIDVDAACGAEDLSEVFHAGPRCHFRTAAVNVDRGMMQGIEHFIGHVGWAGNGKMPMTIGKRHETGPLIEADTQRRCRTVPLVARNGKTSGAQIGVQTGNV